LLLLISLSSLLKSLINPSLDNIDVKFAVSNTDVNRAIFVPEANLVVSGTFRIARDICTIGIWVKSIIAVVSLPLPELTQTPAPEIGAVEAEVPLTPKQKAAKTRAAKKAALLAAV
jgi:hypothetical protein